MFIELLDPLQGGDWRGKRATQSRGEEQHLKEAVKIL